MGILLLIRPALFTFSDGRYVGASLDRNGLRPCRFYITSDDMMICASEVGTISIPSDTIVSKGRLQPGKMLLVDTREGRIVDDRELKMKICSSRPFGQWIEDNVLTMTAMKEWMSKNDLMDEVVLDEVLLKDDRRVEAFGFTLEQLTTLIVPMVFLNLIRSKMVKSLLGQWELILLWPVYRKIRE
jgi:glutamate synthase (NADPH/NADH)